MTTYEPFFRTRIEDAYADASFMRNTIKNAIYIMRLGGMYKAIPFDGVATHRLYNWEVADRLSDRDVKDPRR